MGQDIYPIPVGGIIDEEVVGTEVLPPEPSDLTSWTRVRKVLEALHQPGVNTIKAACGEAQVSRATFYRDISEPIVTAKLAEWMGAADAVIAGMITSHWPAVLDHQLQIAEGQVGQARDSTPAARFVQTELERLREQVVAEKQSGPSDAAKVLAKFKERASKVKATRTTVVEELELEG